MEKQSLAKGLRVSQSEQAPHLFDAFQERLGNLLNHLREFYRTHGYEAGHSSREKTEVYLEWLRVDIDSYDQLTLAGIVPEPVSSSQQTLAQYLASFNMYEMLNLKWRLRFRERSYRVLRTLQLQQQANYLSSLLSLAAGRIDLGSTCKIITLGPFRSMVQFSYYQSSTEIIVLALEMNQVPVVASGRLLSFECSHVMVVIDFVNSPEKIDRSLAQYLAGVYMDPARQVSLKPGTVSQCSDLTQGFLKVVEVLPGGLFGPCRSEIIVVPSDKSEQFQLDTELNRWVLSSQRPQSNQWDIFLRNKSNSSLITSLADSESCRLFVHFLQRRVSCFPFALSAQEEDAIGTPGNVLIIGRSGTGKTTCTLLRLLSAQALFRWRIRQQSDFSMELFGLHSVFVTASATLSIEVKRFYDNLVAKLGGRTVHTETRSEKEANERDISIKPSMSLMTHRDFPLFSTTRLLVMAIDASLRHPFFKVTEEGASTAVQAGFHNELKGVKIITHHGRGMSEQVSNQLETQSTFSVQSKKVAKSRLNTENLFGEKTSFEIDFNYFSRRFWPLLYERVPLSPDAVWAEISGKLKGSLLSYRYEWGYIDKATYITANKKTSSLTFEEKEIVWDVFMKYESWKRDKSAYDFQDVVTHILREIEVHGYEGAPIHFLSIDEVQDVTYATLMLLAKITMCNFVLAGDTAQTIAKGSNFRFKDLNGLFSEHGGRLRAEPLTTKQLLVNYRSHDGILQLANCVVGLIELLFPKSIDKLQREVSEPGRTHVRPTILVRTSEIQILSTLADASTSSNVLFGSQRVILVTNDSIRQGIPDFLKDILCLTIYESKGLEFEDVIVFNFFGNCGVEEEDWAMLRDVLFDRREQRWMSVDRIKLSEKFLGSFQPTRYMSLCTALKMLYVAITRTKRKLVIYENSRHGEDFLNYLQSMFSMEAPRACSSSDWKVQVDTSPQALLHWDSMGRHLLEENQFVPAARCFRHAQNYRMERKANTLNLADEAARKLQAAEAIIEDRSSSLIRKVAAEGKRNNACEVFKKAANDFLAIGELPLAARCFYSGRSFEDAATIYEGLTAWNESGDSWYKAKMFARAAELFEKVNNYPKVLESFDAGEFWEEYIRTLVKVKDNLDLTLRIAVIKKYSKLSIEKVIKRYWRRKEQLTEKLVPVEAFSSASDVVFQRPFLSLHLLRILGPKESKKLRHWFKSNNPFLRVSLNDIFDFESSPKCEYGYSYLSSESANMRPAGRVVERNLWYSTAEILNEILTVVLLYQNDAFEKMHRKPAFLLTSGCHLLQTKDQIETAEYVLKVFGLEKYGFVLLNAYRLTSMAVDYIVSLIKCLSSVHMIKAEQRFSQHFEKYGRCLGAVPLTMIHYCLEMANEETIGKFFELSPEFFTEMVLLGYWKKVLSLTKFPGLFLSYAFGDRLHFEYFSRKMYECSPESLREISIKRISSEALTFAEQEMLLYDLEKTISLLNDECPITLNKGTRARGFADFHPYFKWNKALWEWIRKPDERNREILKTCIRGMSELMRDMTSLSRKFNSLELADFFSFFVQLISMYQLHSGKEGFSIMGFELFETFLGAFKLWNTIIHLLIMESHYVLHYRQILRGTFIPFGIRLLSEDPLTAYFPVYSHSIMSAECVFFNEAAKVIRMYSVDVEGNFFLAPITEVLLYVRVVMEQFVSQMVMDRTKIQVLSRKINDEQKRLSAAACIFGEIMYLKPIHELLSQDCKSLAMALAEECKELDQRKWKDDLSKNNFIKTLIDREELLNKLNDSTRNYDFHYLPKSADDCLRVIFMCGFMRVLKPITITNIGRVALGRHLVEKSKSYANGDLQLIEVIHQLCTCQPFFHVTQNILRSNLVNISLEIPQYLSMVLAIKMKNLSPKKDKFSNIRKCRLFASFSCISQANCKAGPPFAPIYAMHLMMTSHHILDLLHALREDLRHHITLEYVIGRIKETIYKRCQLIPRFLRVNGLSRNHFNGFLHSLYCPWKGWVYLTRGQRLEQWLQSLREGRPSELSEVPIKTEESSKSANTPLKEVMTTEEQKSDERKSGAGRPIKIKNKFTAEIHSQSFKEEQQRVVREWREMINGDWDLHFSIKWNVSLACKLKENKLFIGSLISQTSENVVSTSTQLGPVLERMHVLSQFREFEFEKLHYRSQTFQERQKCINNIKLVSENLLKLLKTFTTSLKNEDTSESLVNARTECDKFIQKFFR